MILTVRRVVAVAALGLVSATVAVPASAQTDLAPIAADRCGTAATLASTSSQRLGTEVTVDLYVYDTNADPLEPGYPICSFAIISGSTELVGRYFLSASGGGNSISEEFTGTSTVTEPLGLYSVQYPVTARVMGLHTTWRDSTIVTTVAKTPAQKKAAKKKYTKAVKKAKKAYAKAGRTKKAKKVMTKKIAVAKKAYAKAIRSTSVTRTTTTGSSSLFDVSTSTPSLP